MPRAPHFMPLLLLLLLLSLPHTQAAFPQDPLPLLTSDLQGEFPELCSGVQVPLCGGGEVQGGSSLQEAQGLSSKGGQTGRGLATLVRHSHPWADFLCCEAAPRGG